VAAAAAVAFRFAAGREAGDQQHHEQQAIGRCFLQAHLRNRLHNAIPGRKAHYFLRPGLYSLPERGVYAVSPTDIPMRLDCLQALGISHAEAA
jgi:hypothetical protein